MKRDRFGFDVPAGSCYDESIHEPEGSEIDELGESCLPGDDSQVFRELWKLGIETPSGQDLATHGLRFNRISSSW